MSAQVHNGIEGGAIIRGSQARGQVLTFFRLEGVKPLAAHTHMSFQNDLLHSVGFDKMDAPGLNEPVDLALRRLGQNGA